MILRAYRAELDPTIEQRKALARQAGAARWTYNWALSRWRALYAEAKAKVAPGAKVTGGPSWYSICRELTQLKKTPEVAWLNECSSYALREAVADLGAAYQHFFRRLKEGKVGRAAGAPDFRSRHDPSGRGFRCAQPEAISVRGIDAESREIKVAGIGWVKLLRKGYVPLAANYRGLSVRQVAGRWYAAVQVEEADRVQAAPSTGRLGVEVGVRVTAISSDGTTGAAVRENPNLPAIRDGSSSGSGGRPGATSRARSRASSPAAGTRLRRACARPTTGSPACDRTRSIR